MPHNRYYQIILLSIDDDHESSEDVSDKPIDNIRIISITPTDGKVTANSVGYELECKAEGEPSPTITWKTGAV